ncbi:hypothetical protein C8R43DRAFT_1233053 [Mycena crocata]|nr:hypothetical protein C8R43DRAFT_1233053 [Mycena crocata]
MVQAFANILALTILVSYAVSASAVPMQPVNGSTAGPAIIDPISGTAKASDLVGKAVSPKASSIVVASTSVRKAPPSSSAPAASKSTSASGTNYITLQSGLAKSSTTKAIASPSAVKRQGGGSPPLGMGPARGSGMPSGVHSGMPSLSGFNQGSFPRPSGRPGGAGASGAHNTGGGATGAGASDVPNPVPARPDEPAPSDIASAAAATAINSAA